MGTARSVPNATNDISFGLGHSDSCAGCAQRQNRLDSHPYLMDTNKTVHTFVRTTASVERKCLVKANKRDNNTLHTEPRAARLLETMMFAAAR